MAYEINQSSMPWTCFPDGLDTSELIDISTIDSLWGKFYDPKTDKTHDCSEYFDAATKDTDGV